MYFWHTDLENRCRNRNIANWERFFAETRKLMHTNGTEIPDFKRFSISHIQFRARRAKVGVGESTIDPVVSFDCNTRFQQQSKLTNVSWCIQTSFCQFFDVLGVLECFQLGLLPCNTRRGWRIHFRILAPDRSEVEMTPEAASSKIQCFSTPYPSKADNSDPLGQKLSLWAESHAFRSFQRWFWPIWLRAWRTL